MAVDHGTAGGMEGVRKLARSQSIKLCEKLKIPAPKTARSVSAGNCEEDIEEDDSSAPTQLPILRSFHSTSKENSDKDKTNGEWVTEVRTGQYLCAINVLTHGLST